jgi:hypothetical protein
MPWVDYFERLSPATLDQLDRFYAQAAWFKDPFHEVEGIEAIGAILRHTFDRLPGARFRVTRQFSASDGDLMLLWELDFVMPITSAPTHHRWCHPFCVRCRRQGDSPPRLLGCRRGALWPPAAAEVADARSGPPGSRAGSVSAKHSRVSERPDPYPIT